jgi:hypothetical protein
MSAAEGTINQRQPYSFEQAPYTLEDPNTISRDKPRYLFFAGNVIDPRRARERAPSDPLRHGGEEIATRTAVVTNGFLPRCFITPLTVAGEILPEELAPEGVDKFRVRTEGDTQLEGVHGRISGFAKGLVAIKVYPGDDVVNILSGGTNNTDNIRKGIVELTALRGMEWSDVKASNLQQAIFPTFPQLPQTLREVEDQIRAARAKHQDSDLFQSVCDGMLDSCSQFRDWANARIETEHTLLRVGTTKDGHVYTYSPLGE